MDEYSHHESEKFKNALLGKLKIPVAKCVNCTCSEVVMCAFFATKHFQKIEFFWLRDYFLTWKTRKLGTFSRFPMVPSFPYGRYLRFIHLGILRLEITLDAKFCVHSIFISEYRKSDPFCLYWS